MSISSGAGVVVEPIPGSRNFFRRGPTAATAQIFTVAYCMHV